MDASERGASPPSGTPPAAAQAFRYLLASEARFLDAAVARLIPADELGPGAKEAGVTVYIDRQLASAWGTHGRNYRMGPWREGTPEQGYQSPLTPQELYRQAIREVDAWCVGHHRRPFCLLPSEVQDEVLTQLEAETIALEVIGASVFFDLLLRNVEEGFFADPLYGGNRDKIGWRLIGFPGLASSAYPEHLGKANVPYRVEPVGIEDVVQERVRIDAQGYPVHVPLRDVP